MLRYICVSFTFNNKKVYMDQWSGVKRQKPGAVCWCFLFMMTSTKTRLGWSVKI